MKKQILLENGFQPTILCKKQLKQVLGIDEHLICFAKKKCKDNTPRYTNCIQLSRQKNMYDITFVRSTFGKKSQDQNVIGS